MLTRISRTLHSIRVYLNIAVVWMVSTCPLLFMSQVPLPILWGLFWVHQFQLVSPSNSSSIVFIDLLKGVNLYHSFRFLLNLLWGLQGRQSPLFGWVAFFLTITRSSHMAEIKWSFCISKPQRTLCVLLSGKDSWLCVYHLFAWSNLNSFVTLCRLSTKQKIPLFVLARNQTKSFGPAITTWPEVVRGREKRVGQRSSRGQLATYDGQGQSTRDSRETSRHEIGSSYSEEDESRWVGIPVAL